jgi:hypothetical protein
MATLGDFFGRTFHRQPAAEANSRPAKAASAEQIRYLVEPQLAELVGSVVSTLRAAGRLPVPVTDPHGRHWAGAYILGRLRLDDEELDGHGLERTAVAEVVLDGSGRMALNHAVQVTGTALHPVPVSCPSLEVNYERLIRRATIDDEPLDGPVFLTTAGQLMIAGPLPKTTPLAEYLDGLVQLGRSASVS